MTTNEFRQAVKTELPHVTIKIRTVSFQDLARANAQCLTINGTQTWEETDWINRLARQAGIIPDGNLRSYPR